MLDFFEIVRYHFSCKFSTKFEIILIFICLSVFSTWVRFLWRFPTLPAERNSCAPNWRLSEWVPFRIMKGRKKKGKKKVRGFSSDRMKLENSIGRLEKEIVFSINFLVWLCCDPKLFSFDYRQVAYTRDKIDYSSTLRCIIRINKIPG